jgi:hypothetical protein
MQQRGTQSLAEVAGQSCWTDNTTFCSTITAVVLRQWMHHNGAPSKVCNVLCLLQGYTTYAAVVYVMTAIIGCCLLACGWVAFKFNKNGVVPNKW